MVIGVSLTHNKDDVENSSQIDKLSSLITQKTESFDTYDDEGKVNGAFDTYYHQFTSLNIDHRVLIFQVIPHNVTPPENRYEVNSGGIVQFAETDKVGDHPRFDNWALKRAVDNGCDLIVCINDISLFDPQDLVNCINELGTCILDTFPWGIVFHKDVQLIHASRTEVLNEALSSENALNDLSITIEETGLGVMNNG